MDKAWASGAGAAFMLACAAQGALAEEGWYAGLTLGPSNAEIDENVVATAGTPASTISRDKRDPGFKVLAGYRFSRHFAVEGGYTHLGEFRVTRDVAAPTAGSVNADLRVKGLHADALGILPLRGGFEAFAKAGLFLSEVKTFRATTGAVVPVSAPGSSITDEINPKFGLGLSYGLGRNATLRLEWERYVDVGKPDSPGELDADVYSVGLQWRF